MGEKLDIDEIITMENGEAEIKKSKPKIKPKKGKAGVKPHAKPKKAGRKAKAGKGSGKARSGKADGAKAAGKNVAVKKAAAKKKTEKEGPATEDIRKKDVQEIIKDAKPPAKEKVLSVVEAALFMSSQPLMLDEIARISGINSLGYLKQLLDKLQKDYEKRGMEIVSTRSGWQMQVRQGILPHVAHLTPYSDITEGCKRTLALVVYKEPMRQADLIRIQGNKGYTYIKQLKGRGLLRLEKRGRTMLLRLTQEFERYFGDERTRIKEAMVKEFGDPSKLFVEPKKPGAPEENKVDENAQRAEETIKRIKD